MSEDEREARVFRDPVERRFEDFELGDVVNSRGRTVGVADFTDFAGLAGNHYPLHIDEEHGRATRFGARLGHGSLTLSIAIGLIGMSGYFGDAIVAQLGLGEVEAKGPVLAGDTLRVRAEVVELEPTKDRRYGRLVVGYAVSNQRSDEVMSFRQTCLVRRGDSADKLS